MITAPRQHVLKSVANHATAIRAAASAHSLDHWLVIGVVAQESAGNQYAIRPERGFWARYSPNMLRMALASVSRWDDHWMQYPDLAAASYGLMQVMYQVALERGLALRYPTELCDVAIGLEAGCRHLRWCLAVADGDEVRALLRYNGGGDRGYPQRVIEWAADARVSGLFMFSEPAGSAPA